MGAGPHLVLAFVVRSSAASGRLSRIGRKTVPRRALNGIAAHSRHSRLSPVSSFSATDGLIAPPVSQSVPNR